MSYSNSVKQLILTIVRQGRSPEETLNQLSHLIQDNQEKSYSYFKQLADSLSIPFTPVDCYEINKRLPSPKTIRKWISKEPKPENQNQSGLEKMEAECIGILNDQGKYPEEWKHFNKTKEAIIELQHPSDSTIRELLDIIQSERVTLDDSKLQDDLDQFIEAVQEAIELNMSISPLITQIINLTSKRMNKRYKRR